MTCDPDCTCRGERVEWDSVVIIQGLGDFELMKRYRGMTEQPTIPGYADWLVTIQ